MPNDRRLGIAEELLEVQRTLGWMDLIIGSISDAVYVLDKNDTLVFANQYFADLVKVPRVFLLGQCITDVFPIKKLTRVPIEYADDNVTLPALGDAQTGIFKKTGHDKKPRIFRLTAKKLTSTDQTVCLVQDISREYELSRMKSDFINLASHQLRTPMTAIMTYSHMLRDGYAGPLDDEQYKLAETIVHASERMIRLVNDLLTITRLQNEKESTKKEKVSISDILEQIRTEVEPRASIKGLKLKIQVSESTPQIYSDASAIHEILSNLVVNAIQYTPEGGKIIAKAKSIEENKAQITIHDNGIGIPKEYQSLLFGQFSRADNALQAYPEGTGLGLYLITILLEKIGGTIKFKSELNVGTVFTVTLPTLS